MALRLIYTSVNEKRIRATGVTLIYTQVSERGIRPNTATPDLHRGEREGNQDTLVE